MLKLKRGEEMIYNYIDLRREFHKYPELSWMEYKTTERIADILNKLNIKVNANITETGLMATLNEDSKGKCLLIRADIDALPVTEKTDLTFSSQNEGIMHACGHDVHITTLLMTAELLSKRKDELNGCVKFLFQPAEETTGGALPMIEKGVMENPNVDACIGFHVRPELETGKIICSDGKIMASPDNYYIKLSGKGGHCADIDKNDNLTLASSELIKRLHSISYPDSIVSVCTINAGTAPNIMPSELVMSGSFRTFDERTRKLISDEIKVISKNIAKKYNIDEETEIELLYPPLKNDKNLAQILQSSSAKIIGEENVIKVFEPSYLGEDFAYFGQYAPSVHFFLGSKKDGLSTSLHAENFDVDEKCIEIGAKCIERFALDFLK